MVNLESLDRDKLIEMVRSLQKANQEKAERIDNLLQRLNSMYKTKADYLPEIDPYDRF